VPDEPREYKAAEVALLIYIAISAGDGPSLDDLARLCHRSLRYVRDVLDTQRVFGWRLEDGRYYLDGAELAPERRLRPPRQSVDGVLLAWHEEERQK
jgi:hypothetical protein